MSQKKSFTGLSICRFATNIRSNSSQLAAGSPNAQFGKSQFLLRHPVVRLLINEEASDLWSIYPTLSVVSQLLYGWVGFYFGIHGKLLHKTLRPYEEFELFVNCFELVFHFRYTSSRYFLDSIFHSPKCVVEDMERPKTGWNCPIKSF